MYHHSFGLRETGLLTALNEALHDSTSEGDVIQTLYIDPNSRPFFVWNTVIFVCLHVIRVPTTAPAVTPDGQRTLSLVKLHPRERLSAPVLNPQRHRQREKRLSTKKNQLRLERC